MMKKTMPILLILLLFALVGCTKATLPSASGTPSSQSRLNEAPTGILGSDNKNEITGMLSAYPQKLAPEEAAASGMFVLVHGSVEPGSIQVWDAFYSSTKDGRDAAMTLLQYTVEGDPILTYVSFVDGQYYYLEDITRDAFGSGAYHDGAYTLLKVLEEEEGSYVLLVNEDIDSWATYSAKAENGQEDGKLLFYMEEE